MFTTVNDASRIELVEFINKSKADLFDFDNEDDLFDAISSLRISRDIMTAPVFPQEKLETMAHGLSLEEDKKIRLRLVLRLIREIHNNKEEVEKEEDDDQNEDDFEEDEDQKDESVTETVKITKHLMKSYTYKGEIIEFYKKIVEKNIRIKKAHVKTIKTKELAAESWEYAKDNIKAALKLLGIEGVFIFIDKLANKYVIFRHIMKVIGTCVLPIVLLLYFIMLIVRWTASPFQRFFNWISKEFDFKFPVDEEIELA